MAKPPWEKPNPKPTAGRKTLDSAQKRSAREMAQRAGRPYPNLVDNMRASKKKRRSVFDRKSR